MKILILSSSNPYKTAGIVALDLYNGLNFCEDNQVKLLTKYWGFFPDKKIIFLESFFNYAKNRIIRKLKNILVLLNLIKIVIPRTNPDYCVQDYNQTITLYSTKKIIKICGFTPDVIIVLFMQNFLSYKNLYELNQITKSPIFLYMMDMAPMTGGCHYAWACKGYLKSCGSCPALYSNIDSDQSRKNWLFKKQFIDKTDLTIIAGTEYQFQQLQKSSLFVDKKKAKILLSVDPTLFKPGDKQEVRRYLNLPLNKKIILFGAVNTSVRRKGFSELIEALKLIKEDVSLPEIHLAIAGKAEELLIRNLPFKYTILGYLNYENLAKAYQAADLLVSPSIEDSGPMMINQSIVCGTPVVAFKIGVAEDLVITDKTGYLVKRGNIKDMADGIYKILFLTESEYKFYENNCINLGNSLCSPKLQINKIIDLINEVKTS